MTPAAFVEAPPVAATLARMRVRPDMLKQPQFRFDSLPLLVEGDSKEIRLLARDVALERLKPTVYSYTNKRYGSASGTEAVRARFTAAAFRYLHYADLREGLPQSTAFMGLVETPHGPLVAQRVVETCNLEVRVKRYHIGSPLHRYLYTEDFPTLAGPPLERWSRFDTPLVCFDWRMPMTARDDQRRLADEPISDDYAGVWMDNVPNAKALALRTFLRLECLFSQAGLILVDICFFIDRTGRVLYGEISPDCMRVRTMAGEGLDKDVWRDGGSPDSLLASYERLYRAVFG